MKLQHLNKHCCSWRFAIHRTIRTLKFSSPSYFHCIFVVRSKKVVRFESYCVSSVLPNVEHCKAPDYTANASTRSAGLYINGLGSSRSQTSQSNFSDFLWKAGLRCMCTLLQTYAEVYSDFALLKAKLCRAYFHEITKKCFNALQERANES